MHASLLLSYLKSSPGSIYSFKPTEIDHDDKCEPKKIKSEIKMRSQGFFHRDEQSAFYLPTREHDTAGRRARISELAGVQPVR